MSGTAVVSYQSKRTIDGMKMLLQAVPPEKAAGVSTAAATALSSFFPFVTVVTKWTTYLNWGCFTSHHRSQASGTKRLSTPSRRSCATAW